MWHGVHRAAVWVTAEVVACCLSWRPLWSVCMPIRCRTVVPLRLVLPRCHHLGLPLARARCLVRKVLVVVEWVSSTRFQGCPLGSGGGGWWRCGSAPVVRAGMRKGTEPSWGVARATRYGSECRDGLCPCRGGGVRSGAWKGAGWYLLRYQVEIWVISVGFMLCFQCKAFSVVQ